MKPQGNTPNRSGKPKGNHGKPKYSGNAPKEGKDGYPNQPGGNNPAWHSPDAKLLESSASLSWSYQTGESIETSSVVGQGFSRAKLPGIMTIYEKISCGGLQYQGSGRVVDFQQPATVAANTLLTEMRSRARLRNTYDAPDVMIHMAAMSNLYGGIVFAKRLAATAKLFAYQNEYIPKDLFAAQGFDWRWFREHLFDYVSELNVIISEVNKVYVPARMHLNDLINERWSNYYSEGGSIKDQIYLFTPAMLCAIDYTPTTDWASCLVPIMVIPGKWTNLTNLKSTTYDASSLYTGDDLLKALVYMLSCIVNHDATPDITGDMMNCFGEGDRFLIPACDPSMPAIPVVNEEILETIHNIKYSAAVQYNYQTYAGATDAASLKFKTIQIPATNEIGDYNNFIVPSDTYIHAAEYEFNFRLLDVHKDPNPYKTMEITRCRNNILACGTDANLGRFVSVDMGAELICAVKIWTRMASTNTLASVDVNNSIDMSYARWYWTLAASTPFHYAPLQMPIDMATGVAPNDIWYIGETDEYAEIPDRALKNMNRISLMTLFGAYSV